MNNNIITVFKTWHMESNTYNYWQDELPPHNLYNIIIGQAIIPEEIVLKHRETYDHKKFLMNCYEEVFNEYEDRTGEYK